MKNKGLWIALLIIAILGVCALIMAALGMGIFGYFTVSSVSTVPERIFQGNVFVEPSVSVEVMEEERFLTGEEDITLVVENRFGNVVVQGTDTDTINMAVVKTAWGSNETQAQENLELLTYEVTEEPGRITIRVNRPNQELNRQGTIDFKMDIPLNTNVVFETTSGDLYAGNLRGEVDMTNSFGDIEVRDVQGGEVSVESNNGEVTLRGILIEGYPLSASSDFGAVNIFQASASECSITSRNGQINLENIRVSGDMEVSGDFGDIGLRGGDASQLTVRAVNGSITLKDFSVTNVLTAETDFGSLDLEDVFAAEYDLLTKNGQIALDGASNAQIKAFSDFGGLDLANIKASILDLETRNGAIVVRGSLAEGTHSVISDFGDITLRLPANQSISCDLSTDFGSITTEFDFTMAGSVDEKHWVGKINDGGGLLTVETQNGSITLEKSVSEESK